MAIRIDLPPVLLPRLRLHWHATHQQLSRYSRALQEYANRTAAVSRAGWRSVSERTVACLSVRHRLRVRAEVRLRKRVAAFEERYEDLVDLLCWAAKDGVHTDRDARYTALRAWMRANYRTVRRHLCAYWAEEATPAVDPFEALFAPENVDGIINAADGIEVIMRTRAALDAYHDALASRDHVS
ncbi:MAG TPA: hypothetical protein VFA07_20110 [Chthonomonadaceae bacterium]|nr:hypothetical protein [Chthonomonadaceae bacterium]